MRRLVLLLLLNSIVICSLFSQEEDWYVGKPIADIRFKGLGSISENELHGLMRPYIGQKYTNTLSWEIQSKLYALDYFDLIVPEVQEGERGPSAVILIFEVQEKPLIVDVVFSGNKKIRRGELSDTILVKEGDLLNPGSLRIDEQAIMDLYLEKGFIDAAVTSEFEVDENSEEAVVTFIITEGTQTKISEIRFIGNDKYVSDNALRNLMKTKVQSLFNKGLFIETQLQEDIKAIERHYGDQGLIDVRIADVGKEIVFDKKDKFNKMIISIVIEEGEPWKFGGITFTGNKIYSSEELAAMVTQIPGETFSVSKFQIDYQRIRDIYAENGYIFTTLTYSDERDEEAQEVVYHVDIVERDRAYIENIIIRGNTKTKSYIIRREFPLEEGEVFSNTKIIKGTLNLYNLQYFETIQPTPYPGSQDGLMDLVLDVVEAENTDVAFGLSFSGGDFPVAGNFSWKDKNFLGRGQILGAKVSISPVIQQVSMQFTEPRMLGYQWMGGIELSYAHRLRSRINQDRNSDGVPDPYMTWEDYGEGGNTTPADSQMSYESHYISSGVNTGYTWVTRLGRVGLSTGLRLTWEFVSYDSKTYNPHNSLIRDNLNNWQYSDSMFLRFIWDTRDLQFDPTKGFIFSETLTYAGILEALSNRNYIKSTTRFSWHLLLFDVPIGKKDGRFKSVFSIESVFNAIFDKPWLTSTGNIAETNGFFVDGMFIARGWPISTGEYYKYMWDNTLQFKFPLVPNILSFDIFLDAVGAWQYSTGDSSALDNWSGNDWRFSLGAGFRFANPQFPIGFYLVKRFQWKDNEFTWRPDDVGNEWYEFNEAALDFVIAFDLDIY